jgi:hypothetical protein
LHSQGKEEAINEKVILHAWKFLNYEDLETSFNASHVLMCCTIHLDGKKQATECVDDKNNPIIIQTIVNKLYLKDEWLRENLKSALSNISEYPEGFLKVSHELSNKFDLIDEAFGVKGIKTLCELLPKLETYDDPLNIKIKEHENHLVYIHTINKIFDMHGDDAVEVAVSETINFVEKVFPYIHPNFPTHQATVETLKKACTDEYSAMLMKRLLNKYGEIYITLNNGRSVNLNMYLYETQKDFIEMVNKAEEE